MYTKTFNINLTYTLNNPKGNSGDTFNVSFTNADEATIAAAKSIIQTATSALIELQESAENV
jgi:hypothetical protein